MHSEWYQRLKQWSFNWSVRRSPRVRQLTLSQKRIYIMPSGAGFAFLLLLMVLLLLAINYQNNLAYGVLFLLVGLFLVTILHTYANLSGLTIRFIRAQACYQGEQAAFEIQLCPASGRQYESLQLKLKHGEPCATDLLDGAPETLILYQQADQRGLMAARPLLIESFYPLGLLRAWTWLQVDLEALVYPRPVAGGSLPPLGGRGSGEYLSDVRGHDEFVGLEPHQPGMSLKQVAWKQYARGQGLHAKSYAELQDSNRWLSWDDWPELGTEARLCRLTHWVLLLDRRGDEYGLRLPQQVIRPGQGEAHRLQVLQALALFQGDRG